jgi:hypothetical protein
MPEHVCRACLSSMPWGEEFLYWFKGTPSARQASSSVKLQGGRVAPEGRAGRVEVPAVGSRDGTGHSPLVGGSLAPRL